MTKQEAIKKIVDMIVADFARLQGGHTGHLCLNELYYSTAPPLYEYTIIAKIIMSIDEELFDAAVERMEALERYACEVGEE